MNTPVKIIGTPFKAGNPGKPVGAVNKTNRLVKEVFAEVFAKMQEDPKTSLETWARKNPNMFNTLITKLIPVQLDHAGEVINRIIIEDSAACKPLTEKDNENK